MADYHWRNKAYWALPENVRNAIDVAKMKRKHSDFYYKLNILNDKLHVYTSMFYDKAPSYEHRWYEKKKKDLEMRIQRQEEKFNEEMRLLELKIKLRKENKLKEKEDQYPGSLVNRSNSPMNKLKRTKTMVTRDGPQKRNSMWNEDIEKVQAPTNNNGLERR